MLPVNLPPNFRIVARDFANSLRANCANGMPAQPENQLKAPVQSLLKAITTGVLTRTEVQEANGSGRPDSSFVELKAPSHGASTNRFKGHDKAQWEKFSARPNILYTDACEWALRKDGKQTEQNDKPSSSALTASSKNRPLPSTMPLSPR